LAKLGPAGTKFTPDFFVPELDHLSLAAVSTVANVKGVKSAVGALSLDALHETGTVPKITASVKTGGQTISTSVKAPVLTAAEQQLSARASRISSRNSWAPPPRPFPVPVPGPAVDSAAVAGIPLRRRCELRVCQMPHARPKGLPAGRGRSRANCQRSPQSADHHTSTSTYTVAA